MTKYEKIGIRRAPRGLCKKDFPYTIVMFKGKKSNPLRGCYTMKNAKKKAKEIAERKNLEYVGVMGRPSSPGIVGAIF